MRAGRTATDCVLRVTTHTNEADAHSLEAIHMNGRRKLGKLAKNLAVHQKTQEDPVTDGDVWF